MQDESVRIMTRNAEQSRSEMDKADKVFFEAISSHDVDASCKMVNEALRQNHGIDASSLNINKWFYKRRFDRPSISDQIAECASEGAVGMSIHPPTLSAVLRTLSQNGLDLFLPKPIDDAHDMSMPFNGLHAIALEAQVSDAEKQGSLIKVARVYLELGVSMHKSAGGIAQSPLAILLRNGDVDMLSPWVSMLVDEGHVRLQHLNQCRKIDGLFPSHIALFDAYFARQQIQSIAAAASPALNK